MDRNTAADQPSPARAAGFSAMAAGLASFVLLASHPGGAAHGFADVLKMEAANRATDAAVHGGFIVVLGVQLVCYAIFSIRLGLRRTAASVAGLTFFAMGAMFLCGSMVIDGLATPAIAARYLATPDKIETAKSLFILMGTLVGFLMPIGLAFQAAAMAAWGWALLMTGLSRVLGTLGLAAGTLLVAVLGLSFLAMNPLVLMAAIAAMGLWSVLIGALLALSKL